MKLKSVDEAKSSNKTSNYCPKCKSALFNNDYSKLTLITCVLCFFLFFFGCFVCFFFVICEKLKHCSQFLKQTTFRCSNCLANLAISSKEKISNTNKGNEIDPQNASIY